VKFNPERFIEKNSFIPFGSRNKMCAARLFAMNAKTIIVLFFRKYNIELVNPKAPLKRTCVLLINESKELKVRIIPRWYFYKFKYKIFFLDRILVKYFNINSCF
jgi:cytochrome P450